MKVTNYHSDDVELEAHRALVHSMTLAVGNGTVREADLCLASKVASGQLRADSLVHGLVMSFLSMHKQVVAGCRRQSTSVHMEEDALMEAVMDLGRGRELRSLLQRFHVNPRSRPRLDLSGSELGLPDFYASLSNGDALHEGDLVSCLELTHTRTHARTHAQTHTPHTPHPTPPHPPPPPTHPTHPPQTSPPARTRSTRAHARTHEGLASRASQAVELLARSPTFFAPPAVQWPEIPRHV